ncbi:MAG: RNA polymerase sigma factor (sigma-70 family) [Pseudohongiellaceae bacterium]
MLTGTLVDRLERHLGASSVAHLQPLDLNNDLQLDELARLLLDRFRSQNDSEAFSLLAELTHERLAQIASGIARRLSPTVDPDDLQSTFISRLFTDLRGSERQPVRRFLALAHTSMKNAVYDQLRHQKRAQVGGPRYQDSLSHPVDPADFAEEQEETALLSRFGRDITELTERCIHSLESREKNVLVAREILGMSYERVAAMLSLQPDQVGMIIRRARKQLADRMVAQLDSDLSGDMDDDAVARTRNLVRDCLQSKERVKNVRTLVQRLLDESAEAGRRHLADLIYELSKSSLLAVPGLQSRLLVATQPRQRDVVAGDVRNISARLAGVDEAVDSLAVASLTDRPSPGSSALDDAERCLAVLNQVEGPSGRQQVATALHLIYSARLTEAETLLRELTEAELPSKTRQNVYRNLTLTLLRQDRWKDALQIAEQSADEWPADPVQVMNVCYAAARLGDVSRFEAHVQHLACIERQTPSPRVRSWMSGELSGLAHALKLDSNHLCTLLAPPEEGASAGMPTT